MTRALRLATGWALALTAAILLNVLLISPSVAPATADLAGAATATPRPTSVAHGPASPVFPPDRVPPLSGPPSDETRAGAFAPEPAQLAADRAAELQAAVDRARAKFGLTALAVGVSLQGQRSWSGGSGLARDGATQLNGESPFAIASITKTFTGALVLQLVEEERLSLDTSVVELLPDVNLDRAITIGQLLSHTSGIADLLAPLRADLNADAERVWAPGEVVARIGNRWFAPGASYGYSNTNFVLLGLVVEKVSGRPFAEELRRRLIAPLDLDATGLLLEEGAPFLMRPAWASAFGASGAMYASASDLVRWTDALYAGHVLLPGTRARALAFDEDNYGLSAQRITVGTHTGFGHSGLLQGFTSLAVHLPGPDVTLVVLGTTRGFDPTQLLTWAQADEPSILDLALRADGDA
jgi:D-alanyl-D-alanine carboxypeptidase